MGQKIEVEMQLGYGNFLAGINSVSRSIETAEHKFTKFAQGFAGFAVAGEVVSRGFELIKGQAEHLMAALEMGGAFTDLAANTGQSIADLVVLRQAFKNAGLGADSVGPTLAILSRALTGLNEQGEPTKKVFDQLGVSLEALKSMTALQQIVTLQAAFKGVANPTDRARYAMDLFGKSGAKMLALLSDSEAFSQARGQVGSLGNELEKNASAFDAASDAIGAMTLKLDQFYVGFTGHEVTGGTLAMVQDLAKVDLVPFGRSVAIAADAMAKLSLASAVFKLPPALRRFIPAVGLADYVITSGRKEAAMAEPDEASQVGLGAAAKQIENVATEKERAQAMTALEKQAEEVAEALKHAEENADALFQPDEVEQLADKYRQWAKSLEMFEKILARLSPATLADRKAKRDAALEAEQDAKRLLDLQKEVKKAGEDLDREKKKASFEDRDPEAKKRKILADSGVDSTEALDATIAKDRARGESGGLTAPEVAHLQELIENRKELLRLEKASTEQQRKRAEYAADQADEMNILGAKAAGDAAGQSAAEREREIHLLARRNEENGDSPAAAREKAVGHVSVERDAKSKDLEESVERDTKIMWARVRGDTGEAKRLEIEGKERAKLKELILGGLDPDTAKAKAAEFAKAEAAQGDGKKGRSGSTDADRRIGGSNLAAGSASPLLSETKRQTAKLEKIVSSIETLNRNLLTNPPPVLKVTGSAVFQ
jgi:hypothetical protein